jgi:release factor glutamine methyltransferase
MTLRQAITAASEILSTNPHLRDHAARDAELLLLDQLSINRAQLFINTERELTEGEEFFFWQSIYRRAANEPIQYITGKQEFYGLNFHVTPAVLIPRPETEHLVEAVLQALPREESLQILDVGTGSGILAITLALNLPCAEITAVDISSVAIAVARRNAEVHNVAHRIHLIESDLLSGAPSGPYDAIVSNPPYVPETDRDTVHPQVRDHEPATALFAGETGLDIYRRLIPQAYDALKPTGLLALEIGHGQQNAIASLLQTWCNVSFVNDLQHIPRVALARRPANPATISI